jgi:hypothetical protein
MPLVLQHLLNSTIVVIYTKLQMNSLINILFRYEFKQKKINALNYKSTAPFKNEKILPISGLSGGGILTVEFLSVSGSNSTRPFEC